METTITLCCLSESSNESSLNFAIALLKSQGNLLQMQKAKIRISFHNDLNHAMNEFYQTGDSVLMVIQTMLGFDPDLLPETITSDKTFLTGIYPMLGIDWERIKTKTKAGSKEQTGHMGLDYNIDLSKDMVKMVDDRFALLKNVRDLKFFRIHRSVLDDIIERHGNTIKCTKDGKPHYRFLYSEIVDGELLSPEVNFCRLWGKEIYADTKHKISNFGNFEFAGTCGARSVLR